MFDAWSQGERDGAGRWLWRRDDARRVLVTYDPETGAEAATRPYTADEGAMADERARVAQLAADRARARESLAALRDEPRPVTLAGYADRMARLLDAVATLAEGGTRV